MEFKAELIKVSKRGFKWLEGLTEQVVSKASCTAQKSLRTLLSYNPLAQLETGLVVTTSAGAPVDTLELLRSAIVTAKKRAALTRTTRAPGKLTLQRLASSLAGAAAVFCLMSVVACFSIFCLVPACFTAAEFFAVDSSFASAFTFAAFTSAAFAFAALVVNSFAVSSASKDSWWKFFGMRIEMPKPSA